MICRWGDVAGSFHNPSRFCGNSADQEVKLVNNKTDRGNVYSIRKSQLLKYAYVARVSEVSSNFPERTKQPRQRFKIVSRSRANNWQPFFSPVLDLFHLLAFYVVELASGSTLVPSAFVPFDQRPACAIRNEDLRNEDSRNGLKEQDWSGRNDSRGKLACACSERCHFLSKSGKHHQRQNSTKSAIYASQVRLSIDCSFLYKMFSTSLQHKGENKSRK